MRRRESFDSVADLYDTYRTASPPEVVEVVLASSNLRRASTVLEIGCGTGQLSIPLARHGVDLVAVEPGANLAARARRNLETFANVSIEASSFEAWQLPHDGFDAVVSANAFHWIDPRVRFSKSAEALRPGGSLTLVHAHHVEGGTPGFFADTQPYYLRWGLSEDPFFRLTTPAGAPVMYPELDRLPEFSSVERHRLEIPMAHSTDSYVGWLSTDSLVLGLGDTARRGFLQDIGRLIESKYHGQVSRNFAYDVIVARRAI